MTVTTPAGFRAAGVTAGLKSSGAPDLALVVNDGPLDVAAAVYTSNRAQANPILWSKKAMAGKSARAVVLNSGGANCFTGPFGYETSVLTAQSVAALLQVRPDQVQVCSTGLIGEGDEIFRAKLLAALPNAYADLSVSGGAQAAEAIITTDTHAKTATYQGDGWSVAGMAKGAGMLAPGMATMLCVITTDADISAQCAASSLDTCVDQTFNRLDSDGCMSTNDQVTLMVSGASGIAVDEGAFRDALFAVCLDLTMQLLSDAEGSSHDVTIRIANAPSEEDAISVGRAIARSNLFKAAVFGNDPNWGRILAAAGTTDVEFDPYNIDVSINGVLLCSKGAPAEDRSHVDLSSREVLVDLDLKSGRHSAVIWTNDLTHDYVHENSAYSS